MADLQLRLKAFVKLGDFFREFCEYYNNPEAEKEKNTRLKEFDQKITLAGHKNGWFTKENVLFSLNQWGGLLTKEKLESWLSPYGLKQGKSNVVALIMAGNVPLVGFHDFLAVLITGNKALVKLSSNDAVLLPFTATYLMEIEPALQGEIVFTEEKLDRFDIIIATGSDNTSRYFEYYFGKKRNIIRKNRNSVAVLTGNETEAQLRALGEDIFRYYGLGCRNVSKLLVPKGYNFDAFFKAIYPYNTIADQTKYTNNYDYNKAVYLMSEFKILENGFLMLKEDKSYISPIATLFYEQYESLDDLKRKLESDRDKLQCIVAHGVHGEEVPFGKTQEPSLTDYADGVDTVEFLLKT